jgi:hypothetical protein
MLHCDEGNFKYFIHTINNSGPNITCDFEAFCDYYITYQENFQWKMFSGVELELAGYEGPSEDHYGSESSHFMFVTANHEVRCQFHQHFTCEFFVQKSFWQLFSSYM